MTGNITWRYPAALKAILSYTTSYLLRRPIVWGMPVSAGIELTNYCNLACPECASGAGMMNRGKGYMTRELFEKIIGEPGSGLLYANLYFQGEPMMHPDFFELIRLAGRLKLTASTNGHFLNAENAQKLAASSLNRLIVSIDGMTRETYNVYRRNGDFDVVMNGIRDLSSAIQRTRSSLRLILQFLVNKHNESQIGAVKKFAALIGASLSLKSMQIINPGMSGYWLPSDEKFRRYRLENERPFIKNSLPNICFRMWLSPVITWDGFVVPCCFDKDANHPMGNIKTSSLREIWYGEEYMAFRRKILSDRAGIDICCNCVSGLRGVMF